MHPSASLCFILAPLCEFKSSAISALSSAVVVHAKKRYQTCPFACWVRKCNKAAKGVAVGALDLRSPARNEFKWGQRCLVPHDSLCLVTARLCTGTQRVLIRRFLSRSISAAMKNGCAYTTNYRKLVQSLETSYCSAIARPRSTSLFG